MRVIFHKSLGQIFYFYSHSNLPLQKYLTLWNWCSYCGYWFHFGSKRTQWFWRFRKVLNRGSGFSFSDICWPSLIFAGAAEIVKYISCPSSHCNEEQLESPILAFSMQSCVRSDASSPERCIFSLCENYVILDLCKTRVIAWDWSDNYHRASLMVCPRLKYQNSDFSLKLTQILENIREQCMEISAWYWQ